MKQFETGKTYFTRSICDYECIFSYEILSRTAKTIKIKSLCGVKSKKVFIWDDCETIYPEGKYSMCPVLKADKESRTFDSEAFFLDYINNYLTVECIAEAYKITVSQANTLISAGRSVNHSKVVQA